MSTWLAVFPMRSKCLKRVYWHIGTDTIMVQERLRIFHNTYNHFIKFYSLSCQHEQAVVASGFHCGSGGSICGLHKMSPRRYIEVCHRTVVFQLSPTLVSTAYSPSPKFLFPFLLLQNSHPSCWRGGFVLWPMLQEGDALGRRRLHIKWSELRRMSLALEEVR